MHCKNLWIGSYIEPAAPQLFSIHVVIQCALSPWPQAVVGFLLVLQAAVLNMMMRIYAPENGSCMHTHYCVSTYMWHFTGTAGFMQF